YFFESEQAHILDNDVRTYPRILCTVPSFLFTEKMCDFKATYFESIVEQIITMTVAGRLITEGLQLRFPEFLDSPRAILDGRPIILSFGVACFGSMGVPDRTFSRCTCSVAARCRFSRPLLNIVHVPYAAVDSPINRTDNWDNGFLATADPMLPAIATTASKNS